MKWQRIIITALIALSIILCAQKHVTAASNTVAPWVWTDKAVYALSEEIVVYFANAAGHYDDWVAFFLPSSPDTFYYGIQWMYTDGTQSGTAGIYDGTLNFNGLLAGSYQARFFFDDNYTLKASSAFTVE